MKQTVSLLVLFTILFLIFPLFADMSNPAPLLPETGCRINDQSGVDVYDGTSYFAFVDSYNFIKLGITTDWESFEIIPTSYRVSQGFDLPVIKVKNQNEIYIAYTSNYYNAPQPQAFLLKTDDGGDSFSRTQVGNSGNVAPLLNIIDDEIEVTCYEGWQEPLGKYERFTYYETSENVNYDSGNGILQYRGTDICWGPVHSNDDIWIMQGGGGDNNGWPTFYGAVSTSGRFRSYPGGGLFTQSGAPLEEIFLGGYEEEVATKRISGGSPRAGEWLFSHGDFDICYVKLEGSSAHLYKGTITSHVEEFPVYSWYPADDNWVNAAINNDYNWYEDAEIIATNYVTMYDTTWVETTVGVGDGSSYFVPAELWIKGEVAGNQCWGASENVRIIGDIAYSGTNIGDSPDGFSGVDDETNEPEYNHTPNTNDCFGLVSEKSIYIAYKNYHPEGNGTIEVDNVEGGEENGHVYLYGAYLALGQGDVDLYGEDAPYYDGQFTFEYQHPHGSTPDFASISPYTGADTLYRYIDLQKYIYPIDPLVDPELAGFNLNSKDMLDGNIYPQTNGYPNFSMEYFQSYPNIGPDYVYPNGTDYPWYNPVWPEPATEIVFERGTIHLFGSIAQTRKGFMHRSGSDPVNHQDAEWDIENHLFGGTHASTGYERDYRNDRRLEYVSPNNFPQIDSSGLNRVVTYSINEDDTLIVTGEYQFPEELFVLDGTFLCNNEWKVLYTKGNYSQLYYTSNNWVDVSTVDITGNILNIVLEGNRIYIFSSTGIVKYDLDSQEEIESVVNFVDIDLVSSMLLMGENLVLSNMSDDILYISYSLDGDLNLTEYIMIQLSDVSSNIKSIGSSKITDNEFVVWVEPYSGETIYTYGSIDGLTETEDTQLPKPKITLSNHPNPFNPSTEIRFNLNTESTEDTEIDIYNIKGQKVKSFVCHPELACPERSRREGRQTYSIIWNGTDQNNKKVASGIYYYTLKLDGKLEASRKMVLLK